MIRGPSDPFAGAKGSYRVMGFGFRSGLDLGCRFQGSKRVKSPRRAEKV